MKTKQKAMFTMIAVAILMMCSIAILADTRDSDAVPPDDYYYAYSFDAGESFSEFENFLPFSKTSISGLPSGVTFTSSATGSITLAGSISTAGTYAITVVGKVNYVSDATTMTYAQKVVTIHYTLTISTTEVTSYKITYQADTDIYGSTTYEYVTAGESTTLKYVRATYEGYSFAGWYTAETGGTRVGGSQGTYTPSGNTTLYAHWTYLGYYTITFNSNNGDFTTFTSEVTVGGSITIPSRTGVTSWNVNAAGTGTSYQVGSSYTPSANVTLYAIISNSATTYSVSFDANDGSGSITAMTGTLGSTVTLPSSGMTREGYTLIGWMTSSTATSYVQIGTTYTIQGNITLYAKWQVSQTVYSFDANGGEGTIESFTVTVGVSFNLPSSGFTKTGYTLSGWTIGTSSTMYDLGDSVTAQRYSVGGAATIYAYWTIVNTDNSSDISFELNGGICSSGDPTQTALNGNTIYLPSQNITKSGYVLKGWALGSDTGTFFTIGAEYVPTGDVTFYAVWYQISAYIDSNAPSSCDLYEEYIYAPDMDSDQWSVIAEKLDYSDTDYFLTAKDIPDWLSMDISGDTVIFSGTPTEIGFYVVSINIQQRNINNSYFTMAGSTIEWTISVTDPTTLGTYLVSFSEGSGVGACASASGPLGNAVTLPSSGFTKTGYTLAAWSTPINGTTVYYPLGSVYTITGDTVFTAYYVANTGVIVFDVNGGTVTDTSSSYMAYVIQTDGIVTMPSSGIVKTGYVFGGWYLSSNSSNIFAPGYVYRIASAGATIVMIAYWIESGKSTCTITYDANGGVGSLSQKIETGKKAVLPTAGYTYSGHALSGWNVAADGTGTAYDMGALYSVTSTTAVRLYAQWSGSSDSTAYNVIFNLNGGSGSIQAQSIGSGGTATEPSDPSRSMYIFLYWQLSGSTGEYDFDSEVTSDITLTAIWGKLFTTSTSGNIVTVKIVDDYSAEDTTIDWGDGSDVTTGTSGSYTHTYADNTFGTITVSVVVIANDEHTTLTSTSGYSVSTNPSEEDDVNEEDEESIADKAVSLLKSVWWIILIIAVLLIILGVVKR